MRRLLCIAALLAASCSARPAALTNPAPNAALAGHKLFRQHCAECHGLNASGTRVAPSLTESPFLQVADDDMLFHFVTNGDLRRGMPSWSGLSDERRWQIVAYLKTLQPSRASK